ncbi:MAG: exopolysaccharide biosynthesis protein [Rhizobiaceae bacterium]
MSSDSYEPDFPVRKPKRTHRPLSRVLRDFANTTNGEVKIEDLRDALGDRSFAALLAVFSAVNLIPVLPPFSTLIFGLPPLIIAIQMLLGHERVWLPQRLLRWSFSAERFRSIIRSITPRLRRLEHFIKPRYSPFTTKNGERLVGVTSILLSILVILPIPGANWIPAFAMVLMGLSLSERDGLLYSIGCAIGIAFLAFFVIMVGLAATHAGDVLSSILDFLGRIF